ncbi:MAG: class I SAM-dependent methyltransferase [Gemmatimonadota bacterium]|nr:class I SAM-dependent methyltransferase [Gemmatimonadota bacterium]
MPGIYNRHILPHFQHLVCGTRPFQKQRQLLLPRATGRVLEIGIGSGHNIRFYDPARIEHFWGLDIAAENFPRASREGERAGFKIEFVESPAESIPLAAGEVDTVVTTYTLCSVADPKRVLEELRRVLKPGGRVLFAEHGSAPDSEVRTWQDVVNPLWKRVAGGCNLNRDVPTLLTRHGFALTEMDREYLPGIRLLTSHMRGVASPI